MQTLSQLLPQYKQELHQLRLNKENISRYQYVEDQNNKGFSYDKNEINRYRIIIALIADKKNEDEWIIEQLFQAEIKAHQTNLDQGLSSSMKRCAYLLASFDNPKHLDVFIQANSANNDTYYEFNEKYLLWNGIENSYDQIKNSAKSLQDFFYQKLGKTPQECVFTNEQLVNWKSNLKDYYTNYLQVEDFDEEFHLLLDLDEKALATKMIANWMQNQPLKDITFYKKLVTYYGYLNVIDEQISVYHELLKLSKTKKETLDFTISLGDLYVEQRNIEGLLHCFETYFKLKGKLQKLGIWQLNKVENQGLTLILLQNNAKSPDSIKVWKWLKPQLKKEKNKSSDKLEQMAKVYALFGKDKKSKKLLQKAEKERLNWE